MQILLTLYRFDNRSETNLTISAVAPVRTGLQLITNAFMQFSLSSVLLIYHWMGSISSLLSNTSSHAALFSSKYFSMKSPFFNVLFRNRNLYYSLTRAYIFISTISPHFTALLLNVCFLRSLSSDISYHLIIPTYLK